MKDASRFETKEGHPVRTGPKVGSFGRMKSPESARHALERARVRGAARLTLTTNERNAAAQALYASEGLAPQSHSLHPGGREVLWSVRLADSSAPEAKR